MHAENIRMSVKHACMHYKIAWQAYWTQHCMMHAVPRILHAFEWLRGNVCGFVITNMFY